VLRGERERGGERETEKERMKVRESEREDLELFKGACMVQCVAVCCSVLQCVAVCCSVLQCVEREKTWSCSKVGKQRGEKSASRSFSHMYPIASP